MPTIEYCIICGRRGGQHILVGLYDSGPYCSTHSEALKEHLHQRYFDSFSSWVEEFQRKSLPPDVDFLNWARNWYIEKWDREHQIVLSPWMREQIIDWFVNHSTPPTRQSFIGHLRALKVAPDRYRLSLYKPDAPSTGVDTRTVGVGSPKATDDVGRRGVTA